MWAAPCVIVATRRSRCGVAVRTKFVLATNLSWRLERNLRIFVAMLNATSRIRTTLAAATCVCTRLERTIRRRIPNRPRAAEVAYRTGGQVGVYFGYHEELQRHDFAVLLGALSFAEDARALVLSLLRLRCWRHGLRLDDASNVGLYIERDFAATDFAPLCRDLGCDLLWKRVSGLAERLDMIPWALAIEVSPAGGFRTRFHLVQPKARWRWKSLVKSLCELPEIAPHHDKFVHLMRKPRRALVTNVRLDYRTRTFALKVELPDVRLDEVAALGFGSVLCEDLARGGTKTLRHLGVRMAADSTPEATYYFRMEDLSHEFLERH